MVSKCPQWVKKPTNQKNFQNPQMKSAKKSKTSSRPFPPPTRPLPPPLNSRDVTGVLRWGWTENDPNGEKIPQMRFIMENPQMKKIMSKCAPFHFSRSKWGTEMRMNSKWPQWWEEPTNENYYAKPTNEKKYVKIRPPFTSHEVSGVLKWGWTQNDPNGEKNPQMRFIMENPQMKKNMPNTPL
jgi:hypothetical protein